MLATTLLLVAVSTTTGALAQSAPGTIPLNAGATCPQQTADQIVNCLAVIESDEAARPGGPCTSEDWACICNKQQGLIACWAPCYGAQPADQVNYNNANCNGQHGVTNAAANNGVGAQYSGSPITTTAAVSGSTGAIPTTSSSLASPTSSAAPTTPAASTAATKTASPASSDKANAAAHQHSWFIAVTAGAAAAVVLPLALLAA
ncbi:hypothetical protein K437DRAFT_257146 [Tilletiaria anomala UBC 951]|uniref:Extracellular membrane protein CFEM domain-containing protein n=1 Tax=Tilletiaria anomala (strain ATCC 24038 / CBS 436.72 / UBC 951) TaxID=1037660 RepID=A0A066VUY9_TILAU|nr:uncharacterized protein K437DRAFT_257146 [Tilletiaria anomala UBC 951]KDN44108.1 hypothetical protein K437DRAFT_257146 [Tilletiaria anomala UBC 951]